MSPARVLLWTEAYWPLVGGLETIASALARGLQARGHVVHVVTGRASPQLLERETVDGVPVTRVRWFDALDSRSPGAILESQRAVRRCVEAARPDVVLLNGIGPSTMLALQALGRLPARLVAVPQVSLDVGQSVGPDTVWRRALDRADWIVAPVPGVLAEIVAADPAWGAKASVIADAHEREPASVTPIPWHPPHLLALGRLDPIKGLDVAVRAFARLTPQYPDLRFTIAGGGATGDALAAQADALGVRDRVTLTGCVTDARADALRQSASIIVMPSRLEGFGIAALESARAGRPVIASDIVALREVVAHEESGLLVPPGDAAALAAAIARLLEDHALAERLGARARVRAAEQFGWAATIDAYDALVSRLVGAVP